MSNSELSISISDWLITTEEAYREYQDVAKASEAILNYILNKGEKDILFNDELFAPVIKHLSSEKIRLTKEIFKPVL